MVLIDISACISLYQHQLLCVQMCRRKAIWLPHYCAELWWRNVVGDSVITIYLIWNLIHNEWWKIPTMKVYPKLNRIRFHMQWVKRNQATCFGGRCCALW